MRERFNQIFGHVAFLPAVIGIWVLADYETGETWMVVGAAALLGYSLVIVLLTHLRQPKTDDSGQPDD